MGAFSLIVVINLLNRFLMNKRKSSSLFSTPLAKSAKKKEVKQQSIHSFFGGNSQPPANKTLNTKKSVSKNGFHKFFKTKSEIAASKLKQLEEDVVNLSSDDENSNHMSNKKDESNSCDVQLTLPNKESPDGSKLQQIDLKFLSDESNQSPTTNGDEKETVDLNFSPLDDDEINEMFGDSEAAAQVKALSQSSHETEFQSSSSQSTKVEYRSSFSQNKTPTFGKNPKQYRIADNFAGIDNGKKKCPFYKKIPNTNFVVDAFSYGKIDKISAYFLSHFHYDHYQGLSKTFPGKVYCNEVTAKLCQLKLKLPENKIKVLPMNLLCNIEGIEVLLLDANHCPGSCMFLFIKNEFEIYLHTGDFRASQDCDLLWKSLEPYKNRITKLFLDTTYLNPTYCFPAQNLMVNKVAQLVLSITEKRGKNNVLFVFGSYTIGKERLFLKVTEVLDGKVSVEKPKFDILNCFGWPEVEERVELRSKTAMIIVKPMNEIKVDCLRQLSAKLTGTRRFSHVIGFIPDDSLKPTREDGNISIYSVPYSEHSSFEELKCFIEFLKPRDVVPTVGRNYKEMQGYISNWLK